MCIEIYTDGSCHTQHKNGAWAAIVIVAGEKTVLTGDETNTSHNRMELLAVIESINFCHEKQYAEQAIVYTDSQYVFLLPERKEKLKHKHFLTNKGTPIKNVDLVQTFVQQIESRTIRFIKVKAHQKTDENSSKYNVEVDKICRNLIREISEIRLVSQGII
jgi:ribonuclease HI